MLKTLHVCLHRFEVLLAAGSLLMILALSLVQMFVRNVLDFGYPEIEIVNRHLLVVSGLMGAVLATRSNRHIHIDALNTVLSEAWRSRLKIPLRLFAAAVCLALGYFAIVYCQDEFEFAPANERWLLPFTLAYPLGFLLMALHFLLPGPPGDPATQDTAPEQRS